MPYNSKLCPRYLLCFHLTQKHLATGADCMEVHLYFRHDMSHGYTGTILAFVSIDRHVVFILTFSHNAPLSYCKFLPPAFGISLRKVEVKLVLIYRTKGLLKRFVTRRFHFVPLSKGNVDIWETISLLSLFSPKAPRLARRGRLRLSFQFRMEIEKPDKKLASSPRIYNHSLGVREGAVSLGTGSTNFGSFQGSFLIMQQSSPSLIYCINLALSWHCRLI